MSSSFYRSGLRSGYASSYLSALPANAPALPTSGLVLRLRTDLISQSGGLASQITDTASGNSCTAAGSARPAVLANALNGHVGLTFDGANTVMVGPGNVVSAGADRSLFFIGKSTAATNAGGVYFGFRVATTDQFCAMGIGGGVYVAGGGAANAVMTSPANWTSNVYQLIEVRRVSNTISLFINGVAATLAGNTGLGSDSGTAGYCVGGRDGSTFQGFTGVICELDVYSTIPDAGTLAAIKAYVRSYYGLTIA